MLEIIEEALTFDDVLLIPRHSSVLPSEVLIETYFTTNLKLNIPIISAPMDTVTELSMAIAMAQEGGIGVIHKNISPHQQADIVLSVKRHESGIVRDPITIHSDASLGDLLALNAKYKISGVPVVDNKQLVGIITNRDIRFESNMSELVKNLMTPLTKLVMIKEGENTTIAKQLMQKHRIERVLIVNKQHELTGIITAKDLQKNERFPIANKDSLGRLRVAAAIGVNDDERAALLINAGVDALIIDSAHGHSQMIISYLRELKSQYNIDVIAGNIVTADAAKALADEGADGVKVGIGPGSICTTRIIAGVGMPQLSAVAAVADYLYGSNIPVIADGGIRFSGDIAKAIAAGASSVMVGNLLAGTDESPGDIALYHGLACKEYRGMGSLAAMKHGGAERYFQKANYKNLVPEGIEGRVPYKGELKQVLAQLCGGLRSSMGYVGCKDIEEMYKKTQFVKITSAGRNESHVHNVTITKEAPNYNVEY